MDTPSKNKISLWKGNGKGQECGDIGQKVGIKLPYIWGNKPKFIKPFQYLND
jgi:hypothetical protein